MDRISPEQAGGLWSAVGAGLTPGDAIQKGDPRTKNLYFDVATVADEQPEDKLKRFAARIRQVGVKRVLYGSDLGPPYARQEWLTFRTTVPLSDDEMRIIAANVAPYF